MCAYSLDHITPSDLESFQKNHNQLVLECDTQFKACALNQTSKQIAEFLKNTRKPRGSHAMSHAATAC